MDLSLELKGLKELINGVENVFGSLVSKTILNRIGNKAKLFIVARTLRGVDVDNNPFVPYSEKYRKFRQNPSSKGKKYKYISGRPVSKVDLFFTGKMQGALTYESQPEKDLVSLYFDDAGAPKNKKPSLRAHGHTFGSKILPQRKFFSLSQKELDEIRDEIEQYIEERLKEENYGK